MSTETSVYEGVGADPQAALQFIEVMGKAFHQGGLAGCKSEGQGKAMALTCLCDRKYDRAQLQLLRAIGNPPRAATPPLPESFPAVSTPPEVIGLPSEPEALDRL